MSLTPDKTTDEMFQEKFNEITDKTPKNDIIFKILFGNPKHPNLLIYLLNAVLRTDPPITSVQIKPTEITPEVVGKRGIRLDILAETSDHEIINVEIQKKDEHNMKERSLFHWSRIFSGQAVVSEKYQDLKKTVCINIVNFEQFEDSRYWHQYFLMDAETKEKMTDLLEFHFFELTKFKKRPEDSPIRFWLEFIDDPFADKFREKYHLEPIYKEALERYKETIADPEVQEMLRLQQKADMDFKSAVACAESKGEKFGIEKGKIEVAKSFLKMGLSVEQVAEGTGLSIEEVKKLL